MRARAASAAVLALLVVPLPARAQGDDGVYGRMDGDVGLELSAGAAIARSSPAAMATVAARYMQVAGVYATYLDDFRSSGVRTSSRSGSLGIEFRPLFIPRLSTNVERGPAAADLLLDSIGLRMGAVVSRNSGYEWLAPGFEVGLSLGLPLSSHAAGLWLQAGAMLRVSQQSIAYEAAGRTDRYALFSLCLAWQSIVDLHLVDSGDRLHR